jgi:predicted SprT family Zn-dependent metalloprotease
MTLVILTPKPLPYPKQCACGARYETTVGETRVVQDGSLFFECQACHSTLFVRNTDPLEAAL